MDAIQDLFIFVVEFLVAPALELGEGCSGLGKEGSGGEVLLDGFIGFMVLSAGDCEVEADFLFFVFGRSFLLVEEFADFLPEIRWLFTR